MKSLLVKNAESEYNNREDELDYFIDDAKEKQFFDDIDNYPHAFLLACLMDKQISAERAWLIPYTLYKEFGRFDIDFLTSVSLEKYQEIFNDKKLHRYNNQVASEFYDAVMMIKNKYNGDASEMWKDNPSSAHVVCCLLEFRGVGIKIATMTTNILVRKFGIKLSDCYSIDISPDVHIRKIMKRMGLVNKNPTLEMIIYKARELNPEFPGIIDLYCWKIGRDYCHENNPNCSNCPIQSECKKIIK